MQLLGRRVAVTRDPTVELIGRILIPERARSRPQMGAVLAVGESVETVKVGDRVLFGKHAALDVEGVGTILWERDIMAILSDSGGQNIDG